MGKSFYNEILRIDHTYQWALNTHVDSFSAFICNSVDTPLLAVGSGGSLTAAYSAALIHQEATGLLSKGFTPLELTTSGLNLRNYSVLLISAGGNNPDILNAYRFAAEAEPKQILVICMRSNSALSRLTKRYRNTTLLEVQQPAGKDGFLATNSLIATITLIIRAYNNFPLNFDMPEKINTTIDINNCLQISLGTLVVLYGSWGFPVALDIESKFTEIALSNVGISDYRNFAHGRHNWIAKKGEQSVIISLVTPREKDIALRTVKLIPENVPIIKLETEINGPGGTLELLGKMFALVNIAGSQQDINPGSPKIPPFGRKLYRLNVLCNNLEEKKKNENKALFIKRKIGDLTTSQITKNSIAFWKEAYQIFIEKIINTSYGAIVFDYDGTLCDLNERFSGPCGEIAERLNYFLSANIPIGIATGRGESVREDLKRIIPQKFWSQVLVGYYNGSDIGDLRDISKPDKKQPMDYELLKIKKEMLANTFLCEIARLSSRPKQVSIKPKYINMWKIAKDTVRDLFSKHQDQLQLLESSHSIDIVSSKTTKRAVLEKIKRVFSTDNVICIGDKGMWPGNDYQLLSGPHSLSVAEVSPDPSSCWNLGPAGYKGIQTTLFYLSKMEAIGSTLQFKKESGFLD